MIDLPTAVVEAHKHGINARIDTDFDPDAPTCREFEWVRFRVLDNGEDEIAEFYHALRECVGDALVSTDGHETVVVTHPQAR